MFAAPYIPVHVTRISKAEQIWANNLGKPLLKVCHPPRQFQYDLSSLYCHHHLLSCRVGMQTDWQSSQLWHHSWSRSLGVAGEPAQSTSFSHLQVGWLSPPHRERWAHTKFLLILNIFFISGGLPDGTYTRRSWSILSSPAPLPHSREPTRQKVKKSQP